MPRYPLVLRRFARFFFFLCWLLPAGFLQAEPATPNNAVDLRPIEQPSQYKDAAAPGALQLACSKDAVAVEAFFAEHAVPFSAGLVRREGGSQCHIFYEPTLRDFRASAENQRVSELFFDVETLNFLTLRTEPFGDALDIAKAMLSKIARPLQISVGATTSQKRELYDRALAFHFPDSIHQFHLRGFAAETANPWVQDYMKAGRAGGEQKILVTRRLFEGKVQEGNLFRPMLDELSGDRFVRSKLSWEGGDLQLVSNPKNPVERILFYGDSAKAYWGERLTLPEYEYVLKLEFGADLAFDLTKVVPHVDYFVAFLARENIALVSQPVTENYEFARAALDLLLERYHPMPPDELKQLDALFSSRERAFGADLGQVHKVLARAKRTSGQWPGFEDGKLAHDLGGYVAKNCPDNPAACLAGQGLSKLLDTDLPLARRWVTEALRTRTNSMLTMRMLSVIESQLPGFEVRTQALIDGATARLEHLGFKVIRVPRLGGDRSLKVPWSGISYANAVLIDNQFFVPEFGLGKPEKEFFDDLRAQLPDGYKVVPVYARHMMLFNGGAHCVVALVREPVTATP